MLKSQAPNNKYLVLEIWNFIALLKPADVNGAEITSIFD